MAEPKRSADFILKAVVDSDKKLEELRDHPIKTLEKLREDAIEKAPPAYIGDRWTYRIAIIAISLIGIIAISGSLALVLAGRFVPQVIVALGSSAVGALVGIFAPSPISNSGNK